MTVDGDVAGLWLNQILQLTLGAAPASLPVLLVSTALLCCVAPLAWVLLCVCLIFLSLSIVPPSP